mmetsp:Transcript_17493/g.21357  ORF Transcript_17493/g.21357 Transcript_17493/m.21357 type:complete len:203 (+) Transcript_17493:205-813(+)
MECYFSFSIVCLLPIVSWTPNRLYTSFMVHNPHKFETEALPLLRNRNCSYKSSLRKLYHWGFRKRKITSKISLSGRANAIDVFYHSNFKCGKEDLCAKINHGRTELKISRPEKSKHRSINNTAFGSNTFLPLDGLRECGTKAEVGFYKNSTLIEYPSSNSNDIVTTTGYLVHHLINQEDHCHQQEEIHNTILIECYLSGSCV